MAQGAARSGISRRILPAAKARLRFHGVTLLIVLWAICLLGLFVVSSETEMLIRSFLTFQVSWSDSLQHLELAIQQAIYSSTPEDRLELEKAIGKVNAFREAFSLVARPGPGSGKAGALEASGIAPFDARRVVLGASLLERAGKGGTLQIVLDDLNLQVEDILSVLAPLGEGGEVRPELQPFYAQRMVLAFGHLRVLVGGYIHEASRLSRQLHQAILAFEAACAAIMMALMAWRFGRWMNRAEKARKALAEEYAKNARTLDLMAESVFAFDARGRRIYANGRAAEFLGEGALPESLEALEALLSREEGSPFGLAGAIADPDPLKPRVFDLVLGGGTTQSRYVTLSLALDEAQGGAGQAVAVLRDRQRERELQRELEDLAYRDPLTSLPNRRRLISEVEGLLEAVAAAGETPRAVFLLLNLDHFRMVNDGRGHAAGDQLLVAIAHRLGGLMPTEATLARISGDEFAVLLPGADLAFGSRLAQRLVSEILDTAIHWEGAKLGCSCSIGLTEIPANPVGGAVEVLRQADVACSLAKDTGGSAFQVYRPDDPEARTRALEIDQIVRIREALALDRFTLYLQEIRALAPEAGGLHFEILVRMRDGSGGIVPPSEFIPIAERTSLIRSIDRWVVKAAIKKLMEGREEGRALPEGSVFGVNLSGDTVADTGFCGELLALLDASGIAPDLLCFEITESAAVRNPELAAASLGRLKEFGCSVAIDDFGVGQASFGYLRAFPSDYLKIDGSFVRQMKSLPNDRVMVKAMNEVAHILGKRTIAEFAEDEETIELLRELGVDFVQGYAIGKPQPFEWDKLLEVH